jgi:hypothetical protein
MKGSTCLIGKWSEVQTTRKQRKALKMFNIIPKLVSCTYVYIELFRKI